MRPDQRECYLAYGHLMANVGVFEQFMRLALAHLEADKFRAPEDRAKRSAKLTRMDFGQLLQEVYQKFKLSSDLLTRIKQTKGVRDLLAHSFWVANLGHLQSERGTAIIIRQCRLYDAELARAAQILLTATGLDTSQYFSFLEQRSGEESTFSGWETLLADAEKWEQEDAAASRSRP
jgi:hypothetical protein